MKHNDKGASALVRNYRIQYPNYPTLKLARIIYSENSLMFSNVEAVRSALRYVEGKSGKRLASDVANKTLFVPTERPRNPYKLPDSDEMDYHPYVIKAKKVAILNDIHVPYHNVEALTCAIDYIKKDKVDACLINGDLFDFHGLSRFVRDPKKKNFAAELKAGSEIINILKDTLQCPVYLKIGNHEERYQHFLWMKVNELTGVEDFELKNLLARRCEVTVVEDKRIIKLGGLNVLHGHETGSSVFSPVNIARGLYLRAKASTLCGHHHRTSEHTEQDINGHIVTTFSIGCLSELHPQYLPINSWNHGFGIVELDGENFHVRNYRIYKGKVL